MAIQVFERLISVVSIAVLARLLTPTDFGLVAVAATIVAAVELLSAFGFDWALVRAHRYSIDYLNSAWTLRVLLGLLTCTVLLLLAGPAARFYRLPPLQVVLGILGISSFLGSLENVGTVQFRRDFLFHKEFALRATAKAVGFGTTLTIALLYRSYWALISGMVASRLAAVGASYCLHSHRPRLSLKHAPELLQFSSWFLLSTMVDYTRERFSDLYLGRVFGPRINGLFSVANELARLPITELAAPINRVAYSKYAEDIRHEHPIARSYLQISSLIWLIAVPTCAGLVAVAPDAVQLLLGPRWEEASLIVRLLAVGTLFNVMAANTHYLYWALGHTKSVAVLNTVGAGLVIPLTIVLGHIIGYLGVALAFVITCAVLLPINFSFLKRWTGVSFADLWRNVWRIIVSASVMLAVLGTLTRSSAPKSPNVLAHLAIEIGLGVVSYVSVISALWVASGRPSGPERLALEIIMRGLKRPTATHHAAASVVKDASS